MPTHAELLRSTSRNLVKLVPKEEKRKFSFWNFACCLLTFLIPNFVLRCFGMKTQNIQQAWREKVTLCIFIFFACTGLAFLTYGINAFVCKGSNSLVFGELAGTNFANPAIVANGKIYLVEPNHRNYNTLVERSNQGDLANLTAGMPGQSDACKRCFKRQVMSKEVNGLKNEKNLTILGKCFYSWGDIIQNNFLVLDGKVYDPTFNNEPFYDEFIELSLQCDGTLLFNGMSADERECFKDTFYAGDLFVKSYGCLLADLLLYLTTVTIFGLIIIRFLLAVLYSWHIKVKTRKQERTPSKSFCIMLVTCYSEDIKGLRSTIDSLALQDHREKVIFVVCDGMIQGAGNELTTPELVLSLMHIEYESAPTEYNALSSGSKQYNRARVYSGTYTVNEISSRIIVVSKVGAEGEASKGNRGKRDSQVILLGFFSRLLYRDRMCPLDFEIYHAMINSFEQEPALCEYLLMVDADTVVEPTALSYFVKNFDNDEKLMGMTGETKIANKWESWVTMIQVFEYYIAHHLAKSFESVFGGVTCLPGCFCMYRIQSFKTVHGKNQSTPIVVNPFIVNAYSVSEAKTLHQKNLLLLGEDRYLTTLLLKTFYRHKLVFLPAAKCQTQVPASFRVLLSQRRRWINSTIHNLFELVKVDKLCGTFCCSMQFVVFVELFGTLVLPAAIIFTGVLLTAAALGAPAWIPLIMLLGILGLPAVLIFLTTRELSYIFWIIIYIISLPIWNFVLPTYAFWHFDDFSWGETRKVEGGNDHDVENGDVVTKRIRMKDFEEVYPDVETNIISDNFVE